MKLLLENDFVMSLAATVWGDNEKADINDQVCMNEFPFMQYGCWTSLFAKFIGIAIIATSFMNRAPIIKNLLDSKSAEGLSLASIYGDLLVSANGAFYGILEGHPFTAFGENIAIGIQTFIIVLLLWQFGKVSVGEKSLVVALAAVYVTVVTTMLRKDQHYLLMASITPIYLYSRGLQIYETFRVKHTGAQSIATITMSLVGCAVRILTTLQEVGLDLAVLGNYGLGVVMNGTSFAQYFMYKSNTEKFLQQLKSRKTE